MLATRNFSEFLEKNDQELRCLVTKLCIKNEIYEIEDVIQDVYTHFLTARVIERYDPKRVTKISTYLYPTIKNLILSKKMENAEMISRKAYYPAPDLPIGESDVVEVALHYKDIAIEFQNIIRQNDVSDRIDGLGLELRDFEQRYLAKRNKLYTLSKRKNQNVRTKGCRLSDIYNYLFQGLGNKEIAQKYGVSDMFITAMKREIAVFMERSGFAGSGRKKVRKRSKQAKS